MEATTPIRRRRARVGAILVLGLAMAAIVPWPAAAADEPVPTASPTFPAAP